MRRVNNFRMIQRFLKHKAAVFAILVFLVAVNAALAGDPADSACMKDYRKLRNTHAVKVALIPLAGESGRYFERHSKKDRTIEPVRY